MFHIGPWAIQHPTILAPMAGVTDEPFRNLCIGLGAGMAVSEMVTSDERLWSSRKSQQRLSTTSPTMNPTTNHQIDPTLASSDAFKPPRSVQLAGNDPLLMASAAKASADMGANIIDINMGCPAKKVCKKAAGSALLQDEALVERILSAVVHAVDIPVTLKIRTGWNPEHRNGVAIARIAEQSGIQALVVHGRTRACAFKGSVEYDTIAHIVETISIPVFANGDISSAQKAKYVLDYTGAQAIMIGRAAQGNPWIFREINHFLKTGEKLAPPTKNEVLTVLISHIRRLHQFYGELIGVRIARKHVGWYLKQQSLSNTEDAVHHEAFRQQFNRIDIAEEQHDAVQHFFELLTPTDKHTNKQSNKALTEEIAA